MSRVARRMQMHATPRRSTFDPDQHFLEAALRGRTARKVRTHLRRLEPMILMTPRWSAPQGFLEELALDLAIGEPAVGCRTVSFRPLKGRNAPEAWHFILQILSQLASDQWNERVVPMVAGRIGFRTVALDLLMDAQERFAERGAAVALLGHGAEYLPLEALEDLSRIWSEFVGWYPHDRKATMLLAASMDVPAMTLDNAARVPLADFGEAEAAAALISRSGASPRQTLESAARFSGGIPAVVDAVGKGAREQGGVPRTRDGLIRSMGPLAVEIRQAVDIVRADTWLSGRLDELLSGEPLKEEPELDTQLMTAGLLRKVRLPGEDRVMLRAPAIGALVN
ncbi:MAG: hypothetical protein GY913_27105 [Proteobacteria bacterium]|nr:hypothetical protein [Pseudomonadota bacterium]